MVNQFSSNGLEQHTLLPHSFFWRREGCRLFDLACPLSAIGWGSLNKAHTSQDTCWDACWRAFGLPRPWRTKKELCKHTHRRRLQSHITYTKGGSWTLRRLPAWEWGVHGRDRWLRWPAPLLPSSGVSTSEEVCSAKKAHTTTPLQLHQWHVYNEHLTLKPEVTRTWQSWPWVLEGHS